VKIPDKTSFSGEIVAVKARIQLIRSFDEISHQYQGYTLVLSGGENQFRVAIGPAAHEKHQFRIGDSRCTLYNSVNLRPSSGVMYC